MLPKELSNRVPKDLFQNTTTSYKFFWCISILDLHKLTGKTVFEFRYIFLRMISEAWFVLRNNKIFLGGPDHLRSSVKSVERNYKREFKSVDDLYNTLVKDITTKFIKKLVNYYSGNVPYRFLTPWVGTEYSRGDYSDQKKIFELDAPYSIQKNNDDHYITLNPSWSNQIKGIEVLLIEKVIENLAAYIEKRNNPIENGYYEFLWSSLLNISIVNDVVANPETIIVSDDIKKNPSNLAPDKIEIDHNEECDIIINGKIVKVQNPIILKKVVPLLDRNKLKAISTLSKLYEGDKNVLMTFKDWANLIERMRKDYSSTTTLANNDNADENISPSHTIEPVSIMDKLAVYDNTDPDPVWNNYMQCIDGVNRMRPLFGKNESFPRLMIDDVNISKDEVTIKCKAKSKHYNKTYDFTILFPESKRAIIGFYNGRQGCYNILHAKFEKDHYKYGIGWRILQIQSDKARIIDITFPQQKKPAFEMLKQKKETPYRNEKKIWLIPSNSNFFDVMGCYRKYGYVYWTQHCNLQKGDSGYIYSASPDSAIILRFDVLDNDLPYSTKMDFDREFYVKKADFEPSKRRNRFALLKFTGYTDSSKLSLHYLMHHGLKGAPQGAITLSKHEYSELLKHIEENF